MTGDWRPVASLQAIRQRARLLRAIRDFFGQRDVLEVETPLLSLAAGTDPHVEPLRCATRPPRFLNTSPEFAMKRLLAACPLPVYQICKAFRADEAGDLHQPEFTILEWYRPGFTLHRLMDEVEALIDGLSRAMNDDGGRGAGAPVAFTRLSYQQAFERATGLDPHRVSSQDCLDYAMRHAVEIPQGLTADCPLDDWLDWLLCQRVLPQLEPDTFVFLYDYPLTQAALATVRRRDDGMPVAERFELLYGGVELGNAFYELTDADEQARRFQAENRQRADAGRPVVEIDHRLLQALSHGLAPCAGIAIGIDRLLMVLCGYSSLRDVVTFDWSNA